MGTLGLHVMRHGTRTIFSMVIRQVIWKKGHRSGYTLGYQGLAHILADCPKRRQDSSHISIVASNSHRQKSRIRTLQCALLWYASIWRHIIVRKGVAMSIQIDRMHETCVVLCLSATTHGMEKRIYSHSS